METGKSSNNRGRIVARLRHRKSTEGVTEVIIDRLDQEKQWKILDFLRSMKIDPYVDSSVAGQDPIVSIDVSTAESREVCGRLVSFMQTIGVDDVSVSSAPYNATLPEIESEGDDIFTDREYTIVGSDDVERIAERLETGEESEFELILSSPDEISSAPGIWEGSKDVIQTICHKHKGVGVNDHEISSDSTSHEVCPEQQTPVPVNDNENVAIQTTSIKKKNWWSKKAGRFIRWFRRRRKKNTREPKLIHSLSIKDSAEILRRKKFHHTIANPDESLLIKTKVNPNKKIISKQKVKKKVYYLKNDNQIKNKNLNFKQITNSNQNLTEAYTQTKFKEPRKNFVKSTQTEEKKKRIATSSLQSYESTNKKTPTSICCTDKCTCKESRKYRSSSCSCCTSKRTETTRGSVNLGNVFTDQQAMMKGFSQPLFYVVPPQSLPHVLLGNNIRKTFPLKPLVGTTTTLSSTSINTTSFSRISSCNTSVTKSVLEKKVESKYNISALSDSQKKKRKNIFTLSSYNGENNPIQKSNVNIFQKHQSSQTFEEKLETKEVSMTNASLPDNQLEQNKMYVEKKENCVRDLVSQAEPMPIVEQLFEIHKKLDFLANLEKEVKLIETLDELQNIKQNQKQNSVDIGVECIGVTDVPVECIQKIDVYSECNIQSNTEQEPSRSILSDSIIKNQIGSSNICSVNQNKFKEIHDSSLPLLLNHYYDSKTGYSSRNCKNYLNNRNSCYSNELPITTNKIPVMSNTNKSKIKKDKNNKCCFFFGGKKKTFKKQLKKQKEELTEIKTILTELSNQINESPESISDSDEETEDSDEEEDDDEDDDIQFSLTRPNHQKKTVTFRIPLTDLP